MKKSSKIFGDFSLNSGNVILGYDDSLNVISWYMSVNL